MKKCDMNQLSALSIGVLLSVILIIAVYKNKGKIGKIRITAKQWKKWCIGGIIIFSVILAIRLSDHHLAENIIEGNESDTSSADAGQKGGFSGEDNAPFEIEHEDDLINEFPELFSQDKAGSCSSENLAGNNIDKFKKCQVDANASFGEIREKKDVSGNAITHTPDILGINIPIGWTTFFKSAGMKLGNEPVAVEEETMTTVIDGITYNLTPNNDHFLSKQFTVKVDDFNAKAMGIYDETLDQEKQTQKYNFDTLYNGVTTSGVSNSQNMYNSLTTDCNKVRMSKEGDFDKCRQLEEYGKYMTTKNIEMDSEHWGKKMKSWLQLEEIPDIKKPILKNPSNVSKLIKFFFSLDEKINQLTEKSKKAS